MGSGLSVHVARQCRLAPLPVLRGHYRNRDERHLGPEMSTIARSFGDRRGIMTAIVMVGGGIGTLVAPPMANSLISLFAWRTAYVIVGGLVFFRCRSIRPISEEYPASVGTESPRSARKRERLRLDSGRKIVSLKEAIGTRQFWLSSGMVFWYGFCAYVIMVHIVPHTTELGISAATCCHYPRYHRRAGHPGQSSCWAVSRTESGTGKFLSLDLYWYRPPRSGCCRQGESGNCASSPLSLGLALVRVFPIRP